MAHNLLVVLVIVGIYGGGCYFEVWGEDSEAIFVDSIISGCGSTGNAMVFVTVVL